MDNQESILVKADIKKVANKKRKIIKIVYLIAVIAVLIVGVIVGSGSYDGEYSESAKTLYGLPSTYYHKCFGWFGFSFYSHYSSVRDYVYINGEKSYFYRPDTTVDGENIALVSIMFVVLICLPFCVDGIYKRQCKNTEITVSESKVYGFYNSFLFKKSLEMPIEKIDNMTARTGIADKLRSGSTLNICSSSSVIRVHFIHNADEVISATMKRIEEIKKSSKNVVVQSFSSDNTLSVSEKLKELAQMKEQELITEDEYNKKREEIIAKI